MNADLIANDILDGALDDHLSYLTDVIRERREKLTTRITASLSAGDTVKMVGIRPKYMIGVTAKVIRVNRKRAVVILDHPTGRFHGEITVPLNCMQKI